jgi:energy-converting hydrogenase B subunit D
MPEVAEQAAGVFDLLVVATLVGLAFALLFVPGLYRAAVLFIVFGLVLALAWVRLGAFDVALAEAAIGAGLLGALIVGAVQQIERTARHGEPSEEAPPRNERSG